MNRNAELNNLLKGSWTNSDLAEIRTENKAIVRVVNSAWRSEHICVIRMQSPNVMTITIESENRANVYSIEITTRDLLVPIYKSVSLL